MDLQSSSFSYIRDFVSAFVHFPKPLVAGVNGPAVGVMVTTLGLFDLVYTTDNVCIMYMHAGHTHFIPFPRALGHIPYPIHEPWTEPRRMLVIPVPTHHGASPGWFEYGG